MSSLSSYISVRRSARRSSASNISEIGLVSLPPPPNVSQESTYLLQLLQLLSFHKVKHRSITLNEGFNRGTALGEGASFAVKESTLPTDGFLHHLRLRNPPAGTDEDQTFEDAAAERWAPDARGAYKRSSDYSTTIRELRVLCHRPLHENEFIVQLAGMTWVSNPVLKGEETLQERPIILVERAERGSLQDFMLSLDSEWHSNSSPPSLKAKFRMCVRVLRCIAALHQCHIIHADIKTDNVLVYESPGSRTENWAVKLSDFGNSLPRIAETEEDKALAVGGTALYRAPELDTLGIKQSDLRYPEALDVWSWGMLVWEVMNDGEDYKFSSGRRIFREDMQKLRELGDVSRIACEATSVRLKSRHAQDLVNDDGVLGDVVLDCLRNTLKLDPSQRLSVQELLSRVQSSIPQEDVRTKFNAEPIAPINDLPPFDLINHYYDLIAFASVPTQIFKALEEHADNAFTPNFHANLQLGFCHASGFGTTIDYQEAMKKITKAAMSGSQRAQFISARFHRALGVPFPDLGEEERLEWLSKGCKSGSQIAVKDMMTEFPSPNHDMNFATPSGGQWGDRLRSLLEDAKTGRPMQQLEVDRSRGTNGDSILHWCAFLEPKLGAEIAKHLIMAECSPTWVTQGEITITSGQNLDLYCNTMPARTTPIDWAIIEDNMEVLKVLLNAPKGDIPHKISIHEPAFTPTTCAVRFQRLACLRYILKKGHDPSAFDTGGCTPLFYATRPDIFERILRFSATLRGVASISPDYNMDDSGTMAMAPYAKMEVAILELLLEQSSSFKMHRRDDFSCLHLATTTWNLQILHCLLRQKLIIGDINIKAKRQWSPLGYAIALGNAPAIDLLLASGASTMDVRANGFNALHVCVTHVRAHSMVVAKTIIGHSPQLVHRCSLECFTPLHYAAVAGSVPLMNLLVDRGAHLTAAAGTFTPLGLAIAYRSQLGVEEMCKIHIRRGIPAVAAWDYRPLLFFLPLSRIVRPATMVLAPGRLSIDRRMQVFRGSPFFAGSYDRPLDSTAEEILKLTLENPGSGTLLELLKIWYYKLTAHFRTGQQTTAWDYELIHIFGLLIRFVFGLVWFVIFQVDTLSPATRWAIRMGDNTAVNILLDKYSPKKRVIGDNTAVNIPLDKRSQKKRVMDIRGMIRYAQLNMLNGPEFSSIDDRAKITESLMGQQEELFAQNKSHRTSGYAKLFWLPTYRVYLDIEQREYKRFNEYWLKKRPCPNPGVMEFRSFIPPPRISLYVFLFAILWSILGQMLHLLSRFVDMENAHLAPSNYVWVVCLVLILHLGILWPFLFRLTSVYYNVIVQDSYGVAHKLFQMAIILVVVGYCTTGAYFLNPSKKAILPYEGDWGTYRRIDPSTNLYVTIPPTAKWNGQPLSPAPLSTLVRYCDKSMALQGYLITLSLIPAILFFFCLMHQFGMAILREEGIGRSFSLVLPVRVHRFHEK